MSTLTYATVYTEGLNDDGTSLAFERALTSLRGAAGPEVCGHRIAGKELRAGREFQRPDPADSERVVSIGLEADEAVVNQAISSAREALPEWRNTPYDERIQVLRRTIEAIQQRHVELAALVSLETGKTRADTFAEISECVAILDLYCEQVKRAAGFVVPQRAPAKSAHAEVRLLPYGVFGVIAPFNFPLAISFTMVGAALAMGNTVVYKPSALTPRCGAAVVDLLTDVGLPVGALNLIQGGAATGESLVRGAVDGVAFTGSADVGQAMVAQLVRPPYVRPVLAELGGKNPAIVTGAAADLDVAARAAARSAFGMSGQKCNACSRVVVTGDVYDTFIERVCAVTDELVVGDPLDAASFTGPVISETSVDRFRRSIDVARKDGRVRVGGDVRPGAGQYVDLTVVDGLPAGHELTREELFLPVLSVTRVADFDEALVEANATRYGLAAGIFSVDEDEQERFLDEIEAGIVFINNPGGATTGVWPRSQTMSGWKGSGSAGKGGFGPWYVQQFAREQSRTMFS